MSEIAEEMRAYLTSVEQKDFCRNISETVAIAKMHVSIRYEAILRWDLQEQTRFKKWFGSVEGIGRGCVETPLMVAYIEPTRLNEVVVHEEIHRRRRPTAG
ncbi:hypothetical protein QTI33_33905, partial [Variovorax sp. J22P271]|uniref:hypothetical protein n=1 Tax=Variovorax davisae TaxID=3053515 RepID=UPI0025753277